MKNQHTPGPWTIEPDCMFGERVVGPEINGARNILHQGDGPDARLIASAPELLEALEELLSDYTATLEAYNDYRISSDGMQPVEEDASAVSARAAIAKAKGSDD